jgi:septal ring factor EnvC (AmiA/AmiB activator)
VSFGFSAKGKIKDLENQRKKISLELEMTNRLLLDTKKSASTLLDRIRLISKQIDARQEVVTLLNREISNITKEYQKTEKEIKRVSDELALKKENYAVAVDGMIRKKQNKNKLLFVLSGKSMGESLRRMKYLKDYSEWRTQQAEEIANAARELEEKKTALEKQKKEKLALLSARRTEQNKLKEEEQQKQEEVREATEKQKELQEIIRQKQRQANALNAQIQKLIAEDIARQEREAKRIAEEKAKVSGKSVAEESAAIKKESLNLSSNFESNKGRFPMPVTGQGVIVRRFGTQTPQQNIKTENNGIDIQAQKGADARCIFDGEVTFVRPFPGYNNYVIVRHGEYHSFYANIQQVYVVAGQKVQAGQNLGKIFTDPDTGRTNMYFELRKGIATLNPELWLK